MTMEDNPKSIKINTYLISIALGIVGQLVVSVWWAASTSSQLLSQLASIQERLSTMEKQSTAQLSAAVADQLQKADKMARLEERNADLSASVKDIAAHVASIEAFLYTQSRIPAPAVRK